MSLSTLFRLILAVLLLCTPGTVFAQRHMETLGRGVVATLQQDGKVFVSWRLFGNDPDNVAFNVYRSTGGAKAVKLNDQPLTGPTWFLDEKADTTKTNAYSVAPVLKKKEQALSAAFTLPANYGKNYISIPLKTAQGYSPNDCSTGDLDGDGEYEIILHMAGRGIDNSREGVSGEAVFQAYKLNGTFLWEINLGKNIREGAHYTQFMVFDLDGDGKAELVCKTADGTKDGAGKIIGDPNADWREKGGKAVPTTDGTGSSRDAQGNMVAKTDGRIMSGPEYLTVFEGATGKELSTVNYLPALGDVSTWGDAYANRSERYLAGVAYLDGKLPSVIMCRGYYHRTALAAWDFRKGKLTLRWLFDTHGKEELKPFMGQGNHNLTVADVDEDGKDEIVYGAMVVDDNGKGLFSTGFRHGDAMHVSDLDPTRPGLEVFGIHENEDQSEGPGAALYNARTGEVYFKGAMGKDVGRGVAEDIDPDNFGSEMWFGGSGGLLNMKGEVIGAAPSSTNFLIWWNGDVTRQLLDGNRISAYKGGTIFTAVGTQSNNGSKSNPGLSADLFGDWREELVMRTSDNKELRIFTTTIPTKTRMYTLMHDPQYRVSVAWQNVAYNQPPHPGFFIGQGMKPTPRTKITVPGGPR